MKEWLEKKWGLHCEVSERWLWPREKSRILQKRHFSVSLNNKLHHLLLLALPAEFSWRELTGRFDRALTRDGSLCTRFLLIFDGQVPQGMMGEWVQERRAANAEADAGHANSKWVCWKEFTRSSWHKKESHRGLEHQIDSVRNSKVETCESDQPEFLLFWHLCIFFFVLFPLF